jgi:SAM-dependent methyltransferase
VIVDALERVRDDLAFIKECHRVLKTDGRLVITAARKMIFCIGGCPLRSLLGLSWRRKGLERPGYSSQEFFDVLKSGFDVPETDSYSTCCIEVPGLICEALANKAVHGPYNMPPENAGTEEFYHYTKLNVFATLAYPLMWLFAKIETAILGFMPGHNIAAKTKRRVWRVRTQPVLIDGRSIAEAAINTKIGTAAPF